MRQGQQNRRGRGRNNNNNNNNNRKSQNPLTRSFESAGPDVKLRGTPSHIAEKYISLARDAQSSGDPVLAENYLQHAEHYNRIILTYREQQMSQGGDPFSGGALARTHTLGGPEGSDSEEFSDEDGGIGDDNGIQPGQAPQPGVTGGSDGQFAGGPGQPQQFQQQGFENRQPRHDNNNRFDNRRHNNNRNDNRDFQRYDRNDRGDRQDFRNDRHDRHNGGGYRDDRRFQGGNNRGDYGNGGDFRRRDRFQGGGGEGQAYQPNGFDRERDGPGPQQQGFVPQQAQPVPPQPAPVVAQEGEQPAFLRRPVRRPRREESVESAPVPPAAGDDKAE